MMVSFAEYVTRDVLIDFVIKERVKSAAKRTLSEKHVSKMQKKIQAMVPSRNKWRRLRRRSRMTAKTASQLNASSLRSTINYDLKQYEKYGKEAPEYLKELLAFVDRVLAVLHSDSPIDFADSIKVIAQFKKYDGDTAVYRPLSVYESPEVKALISLASAYLSKCLDGELHEEILSYRQRRSYHGKECYSTKPDDAIIGIKEFIKAHEGQQIYVAECDIQKFYDIINHDVVLECFASLADKAGIPEYHEVERVLKAYLDSYSFHKDIISLNDDEEYWAEYREKQKSSIRNFRFEWVSDECFKICYESEEQLDRCKHLLGVPQGGALSCIIANVVLNSVDQVVIAEPDPDRFFVRYGDDILLAHTDYDKCCELMKAYVSSLEEHHLPYHQFKPLAECKNGAKTLKSFWDMKSKSPFLWGPGEDNAFEWIGFVGYEIRYTGETRMRLSTLNKKFGSINKRYHSCFLKGVPKNFHRYMQSNRRKIADMSSSLAKMTALDFNPFSVKQAKSLDRYRKHKIVRLQKKLTDRLGKESWSSGKSIDFAYRFITQKQQSRNYSFYWTLHSIGRDAK